MVNLPRLVAELRAVTATAPRRRTRISACTSTACGTGARARRGANAACTSTRTTARPRDARVLRQMNASVKEGGKCAGAMGPFPFLDGSFAVLGKGVLTTIFGAARVRAFASAPSSSAAAAVLVARGRGARARSSTRGERAQPADDVRRAAPLALDAFGSTGPTCRPSSTATSFEPTRSAERSGLRRRRVRLDGAAAVGLASSGDCLTEWGWPAASVPSTCCTSAEAGARLAVTRSLRKLVRERGRDQPRAASIAPRRSGRKTRLLAIVHGEQRGRRADIPCARRCTRTRRRWAACARASLRSAAAEARQRPAQAGHHVQRARVAAVRDGPPPDLDMSALTDDGNFAHPSAPSATRWWRRARSTPRARARTPPTR